MLVGAMGEMKRAISRENEERQRDRFFSTLVIAASIIAAVRLARDDISRPSPRLVAAVADSVGLAKMILKRVVG
jgi:GTP-sensing pleiotropic transcriptional regulator CodY